jgi:hypothetical protein
MAFGIQSPRPFAIATGVVVGALGFVLIGINAKVTSSPANPTHPSFSSSGLSTSTNTKSIIHNSLRPSWDHPSVDPVKRCGSLLPEADLSNRIRRP